MLVAMVWINTKKLHNVFFYNGTGLVFIYFFFYHIVRRVQFIKTRDIEIRRTPLENRTFPKKFLCFFLLNFPFPRYNIVVIICNLYNLFLLRNAFVASIFRTRFSEYKYRKHIFRSNWNYIRRTSVFETILWF